MRKWQQDLAVEPAAPEAGHAEVPPSATRPAELEAVSAKAFTMTSYHWSGVVFAGTGVLLLLFQPFFVQASSKDRPYEAPTVSYITVFILAALAALGHQLSLGGD